MRIRFMALLVGSLACLGSPQLAASKELKLATFLPPAHPIVAMYEQFAKDVAAATNNELTVKVFSGGALGAGPFQQYKRAVEGVADISDICHAFHAKVFAKTMLIVLPGNATTASNATERLYKVPEAMMASDYAEVQNIFMYSVPQATFISRDRPVRAVGDLKGVKVLTPGAAFAPIVAAWGGTPVPMDLNDMYSALSTGVVDMVSLTPTALLPPWRLSEIAKHVTAGISGLHNPCGAIMNKESYAALSPAHKQAFDKLTGKPLAMKAAKIFDNWEAAAFKLAMESDKIEVVRLSPQERKQFFDAANPVVQKVIADLEKSGVKDVRAAYKAMNK
jgi:TRAP-type C4-dicarboxylate transport system substrate-binding protein